MARRSKKTLVESAHDIVDHVAESATELAGHVNGAVGPALGTMIDTAKEKADSIAPTLENVLDTAKEKAEAVLHDEPEPTRKGGKLRKVLLFGGLAAVIGIVVTKLRSKSSGDNWQSSYTPTPAPTTTPKPAAAPVAPVATPAASTAPASDDPGGAAPDEALSDAVEEPHEPTDPDSPAEVIDVEDVPSKD